MQQRHWRLDLEPEPLLLQARARAATPAKKKGKKGETGEEGGGDEKPSFEVPAAEREFRGDPNDRKALVKHRQRVKVGRAGGCNVAHDACPGPSFEALQSYVGEGCFCIGTHDGYGSGMRLLPLLHPLKDSTVAPPASTAIEHMR